jgi:3-deoxy-7-phosphoheptulonate synthase/chorismate mutase
MDNMSNTELDLLRQQANELNLQILKLINERGRIVQEIGKAKEAQGINPIRSSQRKSDAERNY